MRLRSKPSLASTGRSSKLFRTVPDRKLHRVRTSVWRRDRLRRQERRLRRARPAAARDRHGRTPADVDGLLATEVDGQTVETLIEAESARIGEKLVLSRFAVFDGPTATYLHKRATDLPPAIGVAVQYRGGSEDAARSLAMHIAAARPRYLSREEVPAEAVETERRVAEQTAKEEGKPEQAISKIVEGRVNAYYKDFVLLEQPSITEPKRTVKQILDEAGLTVDRFARFEVGQA